MVRTEPRDSSLLHHGGQQDTVLHSFAGKRRSHHRAAHHRAMGATWRTMGDDSGTRHRPTGLPELEMAERNNQGIMV